MSNETKNTIAEEITETVTQTEVTAEVTQEELSRLKQERDEALEALQAFLEKNNVPLDFDSIPDPISPSRVIDKELTKDSWFGNLKRKVSKRRYAIAAFALGAVTGAGATFVATRKDNKSNDFIEGDFVNIEDSIEEN